MSLDLGDSPAAPPKRKAVELPDPRAVRVEKPHAPHHALRATGGLVSILRGTFAAFLPVRWRAKLDLAHEPQLPLGSILGGLAQFGVAGAFFIIGARHRVLETNDAIRDAMYEWVKQGKNPVAGWSGMVGYMSYALSPVGLALAYLLFEGLIRAAAGAVGEALATFPLKLVDMAIDGALALRNRLRYGPIVADDVQRAADGSSIVVTSCRPRAWADELTLLVDGAPHHVVSREERPAGERRFVYRLAPIPPRWIIRRTEAYRPDALVTARRDARRTFVQQWKERLPWKPRPPTP